MFGPTVIGGHDGRVSAPKTFYLNSFSELWRVFCVNNSSTSRGEVADMSQCESLQILTDCGRMLINMQAQYELKDPPQDAIAALRFASSSPRLLVASWDKSVYCYDTSQPGGALLSKHLHRAPVLDVCFGETDDVAYSAGLDWDVNRLGFLSCYGKQWRNAK